MRQGGLCFKSITVFVANKGGAEVKKWDYGCVHEACNVRRHCQLHKVVSKPVMSSVGTIECGTCSPA